jgi:hypothetical protein
VNDCTDPDIVRDYRAEAFTGGAELRRENRAREGGEAYLREQARIENRERDRDARRNSEVR